MIETALYIVGMLPTAAALLCMDEDDTMPRWMFALLLMTWPASAVLIAWQVALLAALEWWRS